MAVVSVPSFDCVMELGLPVGIVVAFVEFVGTTVVVFVWYDGVFGEAYFFIM